MQRKLRTLFVITLVIWLVACKSTSSPTSAPPATATPAPTVTAPSTATPATPATATPAPMATAASTATTAPTVAPATATTETTDDDWPIAEPAAVGLDENKLEEAVAAIQDEVYHNVHAILVVKDGKLAFERYFSGYAWKYEDPQHHGALVDFDRETNHNLASVTKSITSLAVGIALDHGAIGSVADPVFTYFPQYTHLNTEGKDALTLKHLLTMSSGLQWNEGELPYSNADNDLVRLFSEPDPLAYILSRPLDTEPGTFFYYGGNNTNLLGEVIRAATGQRLDDFAETALFAPLNITEYAWDFINSDMVHASGNLRLRPRDMAKIGQLALNGGKWHGERIVSQAWIEESTRQHVTRSSSSGYGYQWWLKTYDNGTVSVDAFYASGWGGQKIMVFPDLDMIVVFTGGNYTSGDPSGEILTRYILPAVQQSN